MIDSQISLMFEEVAEKHLPLLSSWLNSSLLKGIYDKGSSSWTDFQAKYSTLQSAIKRFVVYDKETPFGYIQRYDVHSAHEYAKYARSEGRTVGIDLFIGEESFLKKGYGFSMLQQFVTLLGAEVERILVDPKEENKEALRLFERYGFIKMGEVLLEKTKHCLLAMNVRKAVRGIILDSNANILLIRMKADLSKGEQKHLTEFWLSPGGKIEESESDEQALKREIKEETGIDDICIERFLFADERLNTWHGFPLRLFNRYYLVRSQETEINSKDLREDEKGAVLGYKWWSLDELSATQEAIFPPNLVQKIKSILGSS